MRKLAFAFFALLLFACSQKNDNNTTVVNLRPVDECPAVELATQPFILHDTIPFAPDKIWVDDTLLVVKTQHNNGFLRIYSLGSGQLVGAYGVVGRGPEEYLRPNIFKNAAGEYLISDKLRFSVVKVDDLLADENYQPKIFELQHGLDAANFLAMPDNDLIIFNNGSKDDQLYFMSTSCGEMIPYNNFPKINGVDVPNFIASSNVFHSSMVRCGDYILAAYNLYPVIDIISIADKSVLRAMHPISAGVNEVKIIDEINAVVDNKYLYNLSSYVAGDALFTLYYGAMEADIEDFAVMPQILKYDLQGNLSGRYKLSHIVADFCVDDAGKTIYLLSFDNDFNPVIMKSLSVI